MKSTTYKTPHEVATMGFSALVEKLGPGRALEFINQYNMGAGDYTEERKHILKDITLDDLKKRLLKQNDE